MIKCISITFGYDARRSFSFFKKISKDIDFGDEVLGNMIYTVHVWLLKYEVMKAIKLLLNTALAISHKFSI